MIGITGKIIAITGASSGIGEAAALFPAERGAKVVLGARRTERLEKLAASIEAIGGSARFRAVDVTKRDDVKAFADYAKSEFGGLDVLVNNAGIMPLSPMSDLKIDEWDRMIDVNIRGVLHGIAAVLPGMLAARKGQIVNIASVAGHVAVPTGAVYCGTKFAVRAISEALRQESPDLRVTTICPGVVTTELGHDITNEATKDYLVELRKSALTPVAIARAIAFAVEQPDGVDVNEVIVRPVTSTTAL